MSMSLQDPNVSRLLAPELEAGNQSYMHYTSCVCEEWVKMSLYYVTHVQYSSVELAWLIINWPFLCVVIQELECHCQCSFCNYLF